MQQFIPFEDDWDAFEQICSGKWVPYQVGLISERMPVQPAASLECRSPSVKLFDDDDSEELPHRQKCVIAPSH